MTVKIVTVSAAMTIPCTAVPYSNFKPSIELTAEVYEGDDLNQCVHTLQELAQRFISDCAAAGLAATARASK